MGSWALVSALYLVPAYSKSGRASELDIQFEVFAEKGTAGLRLKGPLKGMKRAG